MLKIEKSIRTQLIWSFVLLAISPLLIVGLLLTWQSFETQKGQAIRLQKEETRKATIRLVGLINSLQEKLNLISKSFNLVELGQEEQKRVLIKMRSIKDDMDNDVFQELSLTDARGMERSRVSRTAVYSPRDYRDLSGSKEFGNAFKYERVCYCSLFIDEASGEPHLSMSLPLFDMQTGKVDGVLISLIRLKEAWEDITAIRIGEKGIVYIIDDMGRILSHSNPSKLLRGTYVDFPFSDGIAAGLAGEKVVRTAEDVSFNGQVFHVIAEMPVTEAFALTLRNIKIIAAFIFAALFSATLLAVIVIRRIVRPVESLARTSTAISSGDLSLKADISGNDELGLLAESFNSMVSKLVEMIHMNKEQYDNLQKADEALKGSHKQLIVILDGLEAIVYVADMESYELLYLNRKARETFGDVAGKPCWQALQQGQEGPCNFCKNKHLLPGNDGTPEVYQWEFQNTNNKMWYFIQDRAIHWIDGRVVRMEIAMDITERKIAEERMKASLREKEVLLQEIHHRVKNNMQVIASLLDLQASYVDDSRYIEMFKESRNRIRSMSLIHEKLYKSEDLAFIDMKDYIINLTRGLMDFYQADPQKISFQADVEDISLEIETALPCGLVINELISNCLKHAFPDGRHGTIQVGLRRVMSGESPGYELKVRDDGVGLPENFDFTASQSLGMNLITALAEHQLQGQISLNAGRFAEFIVRFREMPHKKRG